jgi:hypothetical protein
MRNVFLIWLLAGASLYGAERVFDFSSVPEGRTPLDFQSCVSGEGKPGEWKVLMDDVPPLIPPLSPQTRVSTKRPVLAQLSRDKTDEHFPLLVFTPETFADFKFTTRVKTVGGETEQMAGIVFRYQNPSNYCVLRISSLGSNLRFYKVANGERLGVISSPAMVPTNTWHELGVECEGNQIRCILNGKTYPPITDNSQALGNIGFFTKSDSVSYFSDAKVVFTPREMPAEGLVRRTLERHSNLVGLQIAVAGKTPNTTRIVGSNDPTEVGREATKTEMNVLRDGATYYGKTKKSVTVVMPLRDRNGEVIAAARLTMSTFKGQTEKNAVERAAPIVREMQAKITSLEDLAF